MNKEDFPPSIHESWYTHLAPLFEHPNMTTIRDELLPGLVSLNSSRKYQPAKENIFNVFRMPLHEIKVVCVGQDPYSGVDQAIGYSFAVDNSERVPKSLQIIFQELMNEFNPKGKGYEVLPPSRDLSQWREQGVFLLNTALTVETAKPGSHLLYWKPFIDGVIKVISKEVNPIWVLWGNHAKALTDIIMIVDLFREYNIIKGVHPAAEAYKGGSGFYNGGYFTKANEILKSKGEKEIMWVAPF